MYICNCNGIREREVHAALHADVLTVAGLYRHCGKKAQCGKCTREMVDLLRAHVRHTNQTDPLAAAAD